MKLAFSFTSRLQRFWPGERVLMSTSLNQSHQETTQLWTSSLRLSLAKSQPQKACLETASSDISPSTSEPELWSRLSISLPLRGKNSGVCRIGCVTRTVSNLRAQAHRINDNPIEQTLYRGCSCCSELSDFSAVRHLARTPWSASITIPVVSTSGNNVGADCGPAG